jgi:hypothetical protein
MAARVTTVLAAWVACLVWLGFITGRRRNVDPITFFVELRRYAQC